MREVDVLVDEIASLSRSRVSSEEFHKEFLKRVVSGLAAAGGVIWLQEPSGNLRVACRRGPGEQQSDNAPETLQAHQRWAGQSLASGTPITIPPHGSIPEVANACNSTEWLLLFSPWRTDDQLSGVLEIVQRPGAGPALERGYFRFLQVVGELLADHQRNQQLRELRRSVSDGNKLDEFALRVHSGLGLQSTAYAAANESRRVIGCDRVTIVIRRRTKCQVTAISGLETFNRRTNTVRLLQRLAAAVAGTGEAIWFSDGQEQPPQVTELLDAYLDESHARDLAILPLRIADCTMPAANGSNVVGILIAERFYGTFEQPQRATAIALCPHAALALHNAVAVDHLPLGRWLRRLWPSELDFWTRAAVAAAVCMAVAAALVFVPADFTIEARGELQPVLTREVFAPADGVIREVRAATGQQVAADQVLLVLRNPELDLEFKRVWGELQTAEKQLVTVQTEQLQNRHEDDTQRKRATELTAREEELREVQTSLRSQYAILRQQQAELEVRSPIAGELLTWSVEKLLAGRPVTRGQVLMTMADLGGPWQLELRIPDRRMLAVLGEQRRSTQPLDVSFTLASAPGHALTGTLDRVGNRTELSETEGAVVMATVAVDREKIPERVPGAGVVARVNCGRRSIGYVLLHDLIDAVRAWFFF
jgi:multidrug efflux pump subunit AcrA (membrane-fusion protein)